MLCQNCNENEANVKYTQIVNGVKKEMVLCEECARKMGIGNFKVNMPINFSNFLGDIFQDYEAMDLLPDFIQTKVNECENCKEEYNEFVKTGLLGCPECYDIFQDRLEPIFKNLQGSTRHIGRGIAEANNKKIEKEETKSNKVDPKKDSKLEQINNLKEELKNAIKEERYEEAAKIRDKIKELENK